jgi:hypothetical protein
MRIWDERTAGDCADYRQPRQDYCDFECTDETHEHTKLAFARRKFELPSVMAAQQSTDWPPDERRQQDREHAGQIEQQEPSALVPRNPLKAEC